jgi:hypothetical protein
VLSTALGFNEMNVQRPLPDLGEWPRLEWDQWKDTAETLHIYMQIVGKIRLELTPVHNHWWNIAFYLTARGLTTSAMPADALAKWDRATLDRRDAVAAAMRVKIIPQGRSAPHSK